VKDVGGAHAANALVADIQTSTAAKRVKAMIVVDFFFINFNFLL